MVSHPRGRLPQKAGAGPRLFLPAHRDPQPHYTVFLLRFQLGGAGGWPQRLWQEPCRAKNSPHPLPVGVVPQMTGHSLCCPGYDP